MGMNSMEMKYGCGMDYNPHSHGKKRKEKKTMFMYKLPYLALDGASTLSKPKKE
jgi:hypothetical protein